MTLFHASHVPLAAGQVLLASDACTYYPEVVDELEHRRPGTAPSRCHCVFATDSLAAASAFINAQPTVGNPPHFYEVEMPVAKRSPFRLIHEISNRMKCGQEIDSAIREYWAPTLDWAFWEYFGPSLTVIREVPAPAPVEVYAFRIAYEGDINRARGMRKIETLHGVRP